MGIFGFSSDLREAKDAGVAGKKKTITPAMSAWNGMDLNSPSFMEGLYHKKCGGPEIGPNFSEQRRSFGLVGTELDWPFQKGNSP